MPCARRPRPSFGRSSSGEVSLQPFLAIGLGEILWDMLPEGRRLGGAPANFAYHVNALGGVGIPVSCVGDDALGKEALERLSSHSIVIDAISIDRERPTGTVDVQIDELGTATYSFPDDVAWDFLSLDEVALEYAVKADAICFGTLAQRSEVSRQAIRALLEAAPAALKIFDINLRQKFYSPEIIASSLAWADVLKINDQELAIVSEMFSLPSGERAALEALMETHGLGLAVLTRGSRGSLIISPDHFSDLPGQPTGVVDTIGAGDSFTAAMAMAYLQGNSLDEINRHAAMVAAYVCGHSGAMPKIPRGLRLGRE